VVAILSSAGEILFWRRHKSEMNGTITLFNGTFSPHGMSPWMWGWGFSVGWLFLIIIAAFWIAVILAIIFLIRWLLISTARKDRGPGAQDSAFEILRMRYAKGEIDKEEFEGKKKDLGH
jgi:putative membrane protein